MVVTIIHRVDLQPAQQLPARHAALRLYPLSPDEALPEALHPLHLGVQQGQVVEVLGLVELLELVVDSLCFRYVGLYWQVLLVSFSNELFKFLLDLQLWKPLLESLRLTLHELRQIVRYLHVAV